jgi:hypothetical protein
MSFKGPKVAAGKVQIGEIDLSKKTIAQFTAAGLLTNPGVSIFGGSLQAGVVRAGVSIGPPIAIPGLTLPASLEVTGIANIFGTLNVMAVQNSFGLKTSFGGNIKNSFSFKNSVDAKNAINIGNGPIVFNGALKANGGIKTPIIISEVCKSDFGVFKAVAAPFKKFDIPHPSKPGMRLTHTCLVGPEIGVYYRGRLTGSNKIELPDYWKDLVHEDSITVQLQPIGDRHYHLNVVEYTNEYIIIKESDDKPIDCFYHVYAERKDVEKLVVEYEGDEIQ